MNKKRFAEEEKALGFNWRPDGLLMHEVFGKLVPESLMYDWCHVYLVGGVAGTEVGLLLGALQDSGFEMSEVEGFVKGFTWPKQHGCCVPKGLFSSWFLNINCLMCFMYGCTHIFCRGFLACGRGLCVFVYGV